MKRLIKIALCVGMAIPVAAFAQGAGGAAGGPGQIQMNEPLGHTYAAGIVRGSVVAMNLANGTIRVLTGKNTVALSATPAQLAGLNPGDLVQFPYVNYQGALWLSPAVGGSRAFFAGAYGQQGRITGAVQAMARGTGEITVRGAAFRIHPAQLQGVLPGMFVNIIYVQVGNVNWVTAIRPAAPSNGGAIGGGAGGLAGGGAGDAGGAGGAGAGGGAGGAGAGGGAGARGAGGAHR